MCSVRGCRIEDSLRSWDSLATLALWDSSRFALLVGGAAGPPRLRLGTGAPAGRPLDKEIHVNIQQLAAVAIKVLGVYYAADAIFLLLATAGLLGVAGSENPPTTGELVVASLGSLVGRIFVAAACIVKGDAIAAALVPETTIGISLTRQELLSIGIALIGVALIASAVPDLALTIGQSVYYGEASRNEYFMAAMEQSWMPALKAFLASVAGAVLARNSQRLSALIG